MNTTTLERTLLQAPIGDVEDLLQKRKRLEEEVQTRVASWFGNGAAKRYHNSPNGKNGKNASKGMSQKQRDAISKAMVLVHANRKKAQRGKKGAGAATTTNAA